ncbi:MAG: hypothetical protein AABY43_05890 [Candidatus Omnitrophota bacterium]
MSKRVFNLTIVAGLILFFAGSSFSQENTEGNPQTEETQTVLEVPPVSLDILEAREDIASPGKEAEPKTEPVKVEEDLEWVWGDVVSVDAEKGQLSVKYLDYETDTEKEIAFYIDEKTVFENAQNLGEIRPQDSASVDYAITNEGKNAARLISVEKNISETPESTPAP